MRLKFKIFTIILSTILLFSLFNTNKTVFAYVEKIYLGGMPAGFSIQTEGVYVVGLCDVLTEEGLRTSPAKESDLRAGDIIMTIDGTQIENASDIQKSITDKNKVIATVKREQENLIKTLYPLKDMSGNYKLGLFIKDDICGIGTVTFIKGNRFASLGHPVIDDFSNILNIKGGSVFNCNITGYVKGERGKAGELRGVFLKTNAIANIDKNHETGVYGTLSDEFETCKLNEIEIGTAKPGDAFFYTTIDGCIPKKYTLSILKTDNYEKNKNFVVKITDENILSSTGGIVQGMSGSPIVQNGKLVGAITHVFINDPTRGFGISIKNMINN